MSWLDAVVLALRSLSRRPGRNALTATGVALGSGLLVALGTIAATAETRVVSRLSQGGPATAVRVAAARPAPSQLDSDTLRPGPPANLDTDQLSQIRRLPHVSSVLPYLAAPAAVEPLSGRGFFGSVVGVDLSHPADLPVTIQAGRLPRPGALTEVAVTFGYLDEARIDHTRAASVLGQEVEIGTPRVDTAGPVRYRGRWFRAVIVGVVAEELGDGDFLAPIEQTRLARQWWQGGSPDSNEPGLSDSPYTGAIVNVNDLGALHSVRGGIAVIGFASAAPEHLVTTVLRYLHVVDIVLGAIGSVALAIAALSITSSLLAAGRERRREIGILKAIGARDGDIRRWFLVEAALVGLAGGIVGTAAGLGVADLVAVAVDRYLVSVGQPGVDLGAIPAWIPPAGVAGTTLLALAAGLVPAEIAARLSPQPAVAAQ